MKYDFNILTKETITNKNKTKNEQSVQDLPLTGPLKLACNIFFYSKYTH